MEQLIKALAKRQGTFLQTTTDVICSFYLAIMSPKPIYSRQQRWEELNRALGKTKNKKALYPDSGDSEDSNDSDGSDETPSAINAIFDHIRRPYVEQIQSIPESDFKILSTMLGWIIKCFHSDLFSGSSKAKRLHLIAPVLWSVAQLLPNATVNTECNLSGKRVHAQGRFSFVLTRGSKRVCVLLARGDNFRKGVVGNLLGCEVGI